MTHDPTICKVSASRTGEKPFRKKENGVWPFGALAGTCERPKWPKRRHPAIHFGRYFASDHAMIRPHAKYRRHERAISRSEKKKMFDHFVRSQAAGGAQDGQNAARNLIFFRRYSMIRPHAKYRRRERPGSRSWPIDFICCAVLCAEPFCMCTYLLYWDVRRAFLWKFCFLTTVVVATMRTADLWGLAWAKYQATGKKLSAVTHLRLSSVSLQSAFSKKFTLAS
jgi:hypothetical protein